MIELLDDFWWLPEEETHTFLVGVAHHRPVAGNGEAPNLREAPEMCKIEDLKNARQLWNNENVFRTLCLFDYGGKAPILVGPFYMDIDADSGLAKNGSYDPNAAAEITQACLEILGADEIRDEDLRIHFSGHKGFNVEVRPEAIGLSSSAVHSLAEWRKKLEEIINAVRKETGVTNTTANNMVSNKGIVIDHIVSSQGQLKHKYLRLLNSTNTWVDASGSIHKRMKIAISRQELFSIDKIVKESERRALNSLS